MDFAACAMIALFGIAVMVMVIDVRARRRDRVANRQDQGAILSLLTALHEQLEAAGDGRVLAAVQRAATEAETKAARPPRPIARRLVSITRDDDPVHLRATVPEGTPAAPLERLGDEDRQSGEEELTMVQPRTTIRPPAPTSAPANDREPERA